MTVPCRLLCGIPFRSFPVARTAFSPIGDWYKRRFIPPSLQTTRGSSSSSADSGPVDWSSLHCPEAKSTAGLPTPTYGSSGLVFTVCTELNISAPLVDVYNVLIDFQAYPSWNTFVFAVDLPANVTSTPADVFIGMPMTFHTAGVIPTFNTTSNEIITVLDPANAGGYSMSAWRFDDGLGGVGIRAEHPNVLVDAGGGVTRYLSFESYYSGVGTALILPLEGNLQAEFEQQGVDLKAFLERN